MFTLATATLAANRAEVTTTNLNGGNRAFDNLKANWNKGLSFGDFKTNLQAKYDYSSNKDFLQEVSFKGDLIEASQDDDVGVAYEVTRNFNNQQTEVKLTASSRGTKVSANYDTEQQLREVSAQRELDIADQKVDFQPSWMVKARTARVKMMSALNDGKDKASLQLDYSADDGQASNLEVSYQRQLEAGRNFAATFKPEALELELELEDSNFEQGATWTAKANVPLESSNSLLDSARLSLTRAWDW